MTDAELLEAFLDYLRAGSFSESTLLSRERYVRQYALARPGLLSATGPDVEAFLAEHAASWKGSTGQHARTALRGFYRWAVEGGLLGQTPLARRVDDSEDVLVQRSDSDLIDAFCRWLISRRRAAGTVRIRRHFVTLFAGYRPELLTARVVDLDAFVAAEGAGWKPATVNNAIASLRGFYGWALRSELIDRDPSRVLDGVPVPRTFPNVAPIEKIQQGLELANPHERAMILLAREAGLRRAEIASLRLENRSGDWLTVHGKGQRTRKIFVGPNLAAALDAIEPASGEGWYFRAEFTGHVTGQRVYQLIHRLTGQNAHSLRHAAATAVYKGTGGDIRATQEFLGHANVTMTQRYVHVDEADLVRASAAAAIEVSA